MQELYREKWIALHSVKEDYPGQTFFHAHKREHQTSRGKLAGQP
jgi:hypothetical protein